ncbi:MAG: glycosyltransferase family 4 protein [Opitutales bacterium]
MMKNIYFYLPKSSSIATSFQDLLSRWQTYAEQLAKLTGSKSNIVMLTDSDESQDVFNDLQPLFVGKSRLRQLIWLRNRFIRDRSEKMMIAGNNFDALFIALLVRRFSRNTRIQASIHMEVEAIKRLVGFKGFIKKILLKSMIPKVDSIRVVRNSEREKVAKYFDVNPDRIVVCPLPIAPELLIDTQELERHTNRMEVIGFVGRIHKERKPLYWAEITSLLLEKFRGVNLLIVGEGPLREQMHRKLSQYSDRVEFMGQLLVNELVSVWKEIHTLLITAPFESYGMAAREALLNGCFVVAPNIDAYKDLKNLAPNAVFLYENEVEAAELMETVLKRTQTIEETQQLRAQILFDQEQKLQNLAKSWVF